jgi:hypothetical protein
MNNATQDFLELLYGHMATYQSRGSFHSTEQLSFLGSGRYRGFLHIKDDVPGGAPDADDNAVTVAGGGFVEEDDRTGYNGGENDISFW